MAFKFDARTAGFLVCLVVCAGDGFAAKDVRVDFTLNTTDVNGNPIQESRYYYLYRPDNLPKTTPVPMVLVLEASPNSGPAGFFHRKADQAGFILVSCSFSGNSTGTPGSVWTSDDPQTSGYEDYDYFTEVISQVRASDNANDAFILGLSKGGHMSLAYACVRPEMIKAAGSVDEFMQLTLNIPSAPLPVMVIQGTMDTNVPYTMVRDTVDAWRAVDGLGSALPVTTYESSPLIPGMVSQVTWRDHNTGLEVAFVTVIGGTHTYPTPGVQTGYDCTDGFWAFFSRFLTPVQDPVKIVSHPVNNTQLRAQPASFHVGAIGSGQLNYQWQKNGVDIPGANASFFTEPAVLDADNGAAYRVVVSNDSGSVTSAAATLTVKSARETPVITQQPDDATVTAGEPVSFTAAADGDGPVTYQWQKNGVNIDGATSAELDIPASISSDDGANFTVAVKSSSGTVTSRRAMLTVLPAAGAPIIITNPVRVRTLPNQKGVFSVNAWSAGPVSYQWQKGGFTSNMVDIPGATSASYTTPLTTLADHLTMFRCVVSNDAGSVTSASEMLFVTAQPVAPNKIFSSNAVAAQTGVPFAYTIGSSGGTAPITYSAAPLPDGLTVDKTTGVISGIATTSGTTSVVMDASNAAGHVSATLTLTLSDTPPVVSVEAWRAANFGASANDASIAGDRADPDGDGYANIDEFTFGSNPLNGASVPRALAVSTATYDFGAVAAGVSSQATLTVTNTGPATFSGTGTIDGNGFAIVSGAQFTLAPGESADVVVSFAPPSAGIFIGQVTFASNGGAGSVRVTGKGQS